jgi:hypothetical protein
LATTRNSALVDQYGWVLAVFMARSNIRSNSKGGMSPWIALLGFGFVTTRGVRVAGMVVVSHQRFPMMTNSDNCAATECYLMHAVAAAYGV